ncbi:DNA helicase-2 / ATP-dependent DNA helicase PcrA [Actinopolyspora mzabensis]|uniref:DNA 3'-5' helicase n=1 Tax=Actinopolyspora mzabensis TaxID=995066 RepID=A0A1G8W078_ACTMZ|nr:ATP-dependent DNA helicase [Actinopolyspora mzabensis]SDJ71453.1 DNA helicase-2 / ATP-dependent DNA helicase PcrA [Actinopolyspora mzabensis]
MITPQRIAQALGMPAPTEEQAAVVGAPAGPALVVAGAGAGKTETMAARVLWLVANRIVTPERVLGLTFTRKAARQLSDRVRARLRRLAGSGLLEEVDPSGTLRSVVLAEEPTVLTYHSYAGRIVSEHGLRVPVEPGARLLPGTASWQLAHSVVSNWTEDLDTDRVPSTVTANVLSLAGELAEHLVEPEQVRDHAELLTAILDNAPREKGQRADPPQELQRIRSAQQLRAALLPLVEAYTKRKRADGAMDFSDQMSLAALLARRHPEVALGERERFAAVLLDEYQDTGHSQRVMLRSLFGDSASTPSLPVTAVGDPAQAIYGWRGASAANLPRFTTDFPERDHDGGPEAQQERDRADSESSGATPSQPTPAARYGLLTSFRNPAGILRLANVAAEPLRESGLDVERLRARDDAPPADVRAALLGDVRAERRWVAERLAGRWHEAVARDGEPPTAAVLVRRRADMADMADALRAEGLPVEVVGLGGLLDEPEVRDLVSALRALVDPLAGTAAVRLLTGSRWRIGAADLAALSTRASELGERVTPGEEDGGVDEALAAALPGEQSEQAGLVDALDDPGEHTRYSSEGYRRIARLGSELASLRQRLEQPLPELVADVERTLLLDIESMSRTDGVGRAHLDAFSRVVTEFATASPTATLPALLDYLITAEHAEDGLEPGEVEVAEGRVQLLTVHAAKGLEWQLVALPHLVADVFPGKRKSSCWLRSVPELPPELRGDGADLPTLDTQRLGGMTRRELQQELRGHDEEFEQRRLTEERRLFYVALTRSERTLLLSGHWWAESGRKPKGPSTFLTEAARQLAGSPVELADRELEHSELEHWEPEPDEAAENPLAETERSVRWPVDPLGTRRGEVAEGADLVRRAMAETAAGSVVSGAAAREAGGLTEAEPDGEVSVDDSSVEEPPVDESSVDGQRVDDEETARWRRDVDVLLAERDRTGRGEQVRLPEQLSVSQLVELADSPEAFARKLRRPLPTRPNPVTRRGTAFHTWLERRFTSDALLEVDELPGAENDSAPREEDLERLCAAFLDSEWAERTPHRIEVPFETRIAGVVVRGRMDAVFADEDGGWTVVDWKTGAVPDEHRMPAASVQLAAYRLAWSEMTGAPLERVRAAMHYVRHDRTLHPADLHDAEGLRKLILTVPSES